MVPILVSRTKITTIGCSTFFRRYHRALSHFCGGEHVMATPHAHIGEPYTPLADPTQRDDNAKPSFLISSRSCSRRSAVFLLLSRSEIIPNRLHSAVCAHIAVIKCAIALLWYVHCIDSFHIDVPVFINQHCPVRVSSAF
jgi:hypothetical protein